MVCVCQDDGPASQMDGFMLVERFTDMFPITDPAWYRRRDSPSRKRRDSLTRTRPGALGATHSFIPVRPLPRLSRLYRAVCPEHARCLMLFVGSGTVPDTLADN